MKPRPLLGLVTICFCIASLARAGDAPKSMPLFNGKDLAGWKTVGRGTVQWQYGKAALNSTNETRVKVDGPGTELISAEKGVNLSSEASFGDCILELEFMVGKSTPGNEVDSNSGVKLMNIYEIQIFDSFGKTNVGKLDCGAIYSETAPRVNASKKPGEWQSLVIAFRAPRFDEAGKKTANARFMMVTLNGQVVQEGVDIAHGTNVSRNAPEHPTGPIYLQGDHGSVAFRNVRITPRN